jgi:hypothetical protein
VGTSSITIQEDSSYIGEDSSDDFTKHNGNNAATDNISPARRNSRHKARGYSRGTGMLLGRTELLSPDKRNNHGKEWLKNQNEVGILFPVNK